MFEGQVIKFDVYTEEPASNPAPDQLPAVVHYEEINRPAPNANGSVAVAEVPPYRLAHPDEFADEVKTNIYVSRKLISAAVVVAGAAAFASLIRLSRQK